MLQNIPNELKSLKQWVVHRNKEPFNVYSGYRDKNKPEEWATFEEALDAADKYDGIGFRFNNNGIVGIDIDTCVDPNTGEITDEALHIITTLDSYTEYSPSGYGVHIFVKAQFEKLPFNKKPMKPNKIVRTVDGKQKTPEIEMYNNGRYFTMTGKPFGDIKPIAERQDELQAIIDLYSDKKQPDAGRVQNPGGTQPLSTNIPANILEKARNAKNGVKFSALFDYGDISGYNSHSEADLALCNRLCFWTNGDAAAIDGYFRQSKLMRTKWDERHGADTYGNMTINRALDNWDGQAYRPPGRPKTKKPESRADVQTGASPKDKQFDMVDIAAVRQYLQDMGISVKYNRITRNIDITGETDDFAPEHIDNNLPFHIYNDLKFIYKKCPKSDVFDSFQYIATNNAYNPVLEMIEGGKWDGVDRLQELFKIMRIRPGDSLSKSLIHKWLWQNISMARNDIRSAYGADGLLVLQGRQGIGKTTFARKMALKDEFFADGLHLNFSDKDTLRRAGSCWIGELGEISRTFKSDIDALKAFITTPVDKYRQPYARFDDNLARRTSFIGTCNDEHYLIDETGNRRFWTVHIPEKMDLDALQKFDALQLYLQVYEQGARDNIQGFRLTDDEQQLLAERNSKFEKPIKAELEVRDILSELKETDSKEEITASKFKEKHPILFKFDAAQIGKALKKNGVEFKQTKKGTLYLLPLSMPSTGWNAP